MRGEISGAAMPMRLGRDAQTEEAMAADIARLGLSDDQLDEMFMPTQLATMFGLLEGKASVKVSTDELLSLQACTLSS